MDITALRQQFQKTIEHFQNDIAGIRTGRATPALVENILVEYYGTPTPLIQLGSISSPEARLLVIEAWDASVVPNIEKSLRQSDLGLNPAVDGQRIRIPFALLTEERRQEFVKLVKQKAESARIALRGIREETVKALKRDEEAGGVSEDQLALDLKSLQKLMDEMSGTIESLAQAKETEILKI